MNGPLKVLTARKILPLLDLLAKFKRALACSCSPNFCVARKLAKQIFYFCSCSQKNRSARHPRECSQRPFVTPNSLLESPTRASRETLYVLEVLNKRTCRHAYGRLSKHSLKTKAVAFYFGKFYSTKVIGRGPRTAKRNLVIFFKSR